MRVCRRGRLEVFGSQRRSIVGERHETSLTTRNPTERFGAPKKSGEDSRFLEIIACSCLFIYMLQYGMMQKCCVRFATVMQKKSNAPCSSVFLSYSVHSCIWIPARSCVVPSQSFIFKCCTSRSGMRMLYGRQNLLARRLLCSKLLYRFLVSKMLRRTPSLNVFGWGRPYGHPNFAMEKPMHLN